MVPRQSLLIVTTQISLVGAYPRFYFQVAKNIYDSRTTGTLSLLKEMQIQMQTIHQLDTMFQQN